MDAFSVLIPQVSSDRDPRAGGMGNCGGKNYPPPPSRWRNVANREESFHFVANFVANSRVRKSYR